MKASQARALLKLLAEQGIITFKVPAAEAEKAKRAISLAKTRSTLDGRLRFSDPSPSDDGYSTITVSLLLTEPNIVIVPTPLGDYHE